MENIVNSTIALYKAYRKTRCGKRDNPTAMRYRMEAIERTVALSERLQRRDYSFGPYYPFKVYEPKERLGLAQRMMNEASDLVADLMEANDLLLTDPEERELRYRAQRSALRNCRKLIHHIELAHEILSGFGDDAFAYWAKMAAGVKNQTAKWYKTDKERAAKLDAQKRHQ